MSGGVVVTNSPLPPLLDSPSSERSPLSSPSSPSWLPQCSARALAGAAGLLILALIALGIGLGVGLKPTPPPAAAAPTGPFSAQATMRNDTTGTSGTVTFSQASASAPVQVTITMQGIAANPNGNHGLHVHATALSADTPLDALCMAAGAHFNPGSVVHGCLGVNASMHAGDLGNVAVTGGAIQGLVLSSTGISLVPGATNCIINRALILHAELDDCGGGGAATSLTTGNSGARMVCGVVLATTSAS